MSTDIKAAALNYLSRREYTRYELQLKITQKGFDPVKVSDVLDDLEGLDFLSDQRFVENYIVARMRRGFGPVHIQNELARFRAAPEAIEHGFNNCDIDWFEVLTQLWQKKYKVAPQDSAVYAKQSRFLLQRGFSHQDVHRLLQQKREIGSA